MNVVIVVCDTAHPNATVSFIIHILSSYDERIADSPTRGRIK